MIKILRMDVCSAETGEVLFSAPEIAYEPNNRATDVFIINMRNLIDYVFKWITENNYTVVRQDNKDKYYDGGQYKDWTIWVK